MPRFSLTWDGHSKNVSTGLSSLQQNGELVDMTLAADGHLVKVHQVIMALASPYLKELINSAACQHPVIFLHNITFSTLCNILEYIYTGEALVAEENIYILLEAAKNLHIKGLENMMEDPLSFNEDQQDCVTADCEEINSKVTENTLQEETLNFKDVTTNQDTIKDNYKNRKRKAKKMDPSTEEEDQCSEVVDVIKTIDLTTKSKTSFNETVLQYTVSNQGSLQVILNRFIYYLKHSNKNSLRQWRCVNYVNDRCPAFIMTRGDFVIKRAKAHTHPFHDDKILKKIKSGAIYSAIQGAVDHCTEKNKRKKCDEEYVS